MTKIDSSQNTPKLMDVSVIDINTWERARAPAVDKTQSAPIKGAIFVFISCVYFAFTCCFNAGRFKGLEVLVLADKLPAHQSLQWLWSGNVVTQSKLHNELPVYCQ